MNDLDSDCLNQTEAVRNELLFGKKLSKIIIENICTVATKHYFLVIKRTADCYYTATPFNQTRR